MGKKEKEKREHPGKLDLKNEKNVCKDSKSEVL